MLAQARTLFALHPNADYDQGSDNKHYRKFWRVMGRYTKGRRFSWEPGYRPTQWERPRPKRPMSNGQQLVVAVVAGLIATRWSLTFWPGVMLLTLAGLIIFLTVLVFALGLWNKH